MGWISPPCHGMGAYRQAPRLCDILAPAGCTPGNASGKSGGVAFEPGSGRRLPRVGLADSVFAEYQPHRPRTLHSPGNPGDAHLPSVDYPASDLITPGLRGHSQALEGNTFIRARSYGTTGILLRLHRLYLFLWDNRTGFLPRLPPGRHDDRVGVVVHHEPPVRIRFRSPRP